MDTAYQSAVSPVPTVTVRDGFAVPAQAVLLPPVTGAVTGGQLQSGAVTASVFVQPSRVAVSVTLVPAAMPVTWLPDTVPAVLVTVPFELKLIVYVVKSTEQAVPDTVSVGNGLTVTTALSVSSAEQLVVLLAANIL